MDSLTQLVLGASVGEAILGKKVGNRAVVWGAIGGTIPDLDVLLNPFLSDVQSVLVHRTFSHSLFVLTLLAPLLGYLVFRIHRKKITATWSDWNWLFLGALLTHPLLDAFTNYGTMLFFPFSGIRVAWRTIFIIDPLYTLPLLIGMILVLLSPRLSSRRRKANRSALILSSAYLVMTVIAKLYVGQIVQENLARQLGEYDKFMTSPTFFNAILWSIVVKQENQYQVGYYSLLDQDDSLSLKSIPQQVNLLGPYQEDIQTKETLDDLITFTEDYYALQASDSGIFFNDLRFGIAKGWFDISQNFIFSYLIFRENGDIQIKQQEQAINPSQTDLNRFFQRTKGN